MDRFQAFSLYAQNLKSFGKNRQGFDELKHINLIVGRNNTGKSALIDLIQCAITADTSAYPAGRKPKIFTITKFGVNDANMFGINVSGGAIARNHHEYGTALFGSILEVEIHDKRSGKLISCSDNGVRPILAESGNNYPQQIADSRDRNPLYGLNFHRLAAERNVVPEIDDSEIVGIDEHGNGATNLIQRFINKSDLPSELVQETLLDALNAVFAPDSHFTFIVCRQHQQGSWEVYLQEVNKGRIALSSSGSGIKTVLLVLAYIHLLPVLNKQPLSSYVFAFEELENNLHPALLRRLLNYLSIKAKQHGFPIFLTTHSSVAIDIFSRRDDAQILHVTHDGLEAAVSKATTYIEHRGILDDLDLRASDLLQANGIIWVEGPSDRIYLNSWINLISGGALIEGIHYQCVFYGGRLLSHLSGEDAGSASDGIPLLGINRNAAIVIDSDRSDEMDELNATKRRIIREFEAFSGFVWVTNGREIENYISAPLVKKILPSSVNFKKQSNRFESFFTYLNRLQAGLGKKYETQKPLLAERLAELISIEDVEANEALLKTVQELCDRIRNWNKIPH